MLVVHSYPNAEVLARVKDTKRREGRGGEGIGDGGEERGGEGRGGEGRGGEGRGGEGRGGEGRGGRGYLALRWCLRIPLGPNTPLCFIHSLFLGCPLSMYQ